MSHFIFVYGTLKRGFCRHHYLQGAQFLFAAQTTSDYRMFNIGTYPGLVHSPRNGVRIAGEIYFVTTAVLARLDEVEGLQDGLYRREPIKLHVPSHLMAEAYFYCLPVDSLMDCGENWT